MVGSTEENIVVGIDVGGPAKGFHAVALNGAIYLGKFSSLNAMEVAKWCSSQNAQVVAVDAPCCWRTEGQSARAAERQLAADRISCFSTPTEGRARGHAFYTWMLAGAELYAALAPDFPLYLGGRINGRQSIETFPQAIACALAGKSVSAKKKREVRSMLLQASGFDISLFENIDEIDAALCAVAARSFLRGEFKAYGDHSSGYIIAARPLPSSEALVFPKTPEHGSPLAKISNLVARLSSSERTELRRLL